MFNGRFSRRSRRLRRQKTVSANEFAKADAADNRRERQLPHSGNNTVHVFAVSLRYNAATLHSSALSAGEYSRKSTQTIRTEETPMSPADHADLRRRNPKKH